VLRREWLAPGTHVTSVGSSMDGPELDRETVTAGLLVIESRVAFQPPPAGSHELQGLDPEDAVELGEVLAGSRPGRSSADQITVYKSMGHAVEDAAAAALVLKLNSSGS
jgi:ornithine cyclodeaminase/alanine dehydrogenase-like protein (mu-crystallin family)